MSNQFSYELDERQIRIMLRDAETAYDPTAWSRFEQLAQPDSKQGPSSLKPRLNLNISRSVLIPSIFIALIGGLSATLFSFVDFKKKDTTISKRSLDPEVTPLQAITQKSTISKAPVAHKPATTPTPTVAATPTVQTPAAVQKETLIAATSKPAPAVQATVAAISKAPNPVMASATAPTTMVSNTTVRKRKPKQVVSEEIPTIKTPSAILTQQNQEPELELR